MTITITSEEELKEVAAKAIHLLVNLRNAQKKWEDDFGSELKLVKKNWETKADNFISELETKGHTSHNLKIEIKNTQQHD